MNRLVLVTLVALSGPAWLGAQEEAQAQSAPKALPLTERVSKALSAQLDPLDGKEHTLNEILQLIAKLTNEHFVLDPSLPKSVGETKITVQVKAGGTVLDAFAVALALTGLRYAILDTAVFISTEGKLAEKLLSGQGVSELAYSGNARHPMSVGEAVTRSQPFDLYQDDFISARDFISQYPWRHWEPARYNPKTGLTDFPGPPVWMDDPNIDHPRFRYTSTPSFLKPEFMALEQEKHEWRQEQERQERIERQADTHALDALLKLLKDHPDMKAEEILKKLGER